MKFYYAILCFFLYGFLGWCVEVAFAATKEKTFVNRGFLNGPICPIYGFGVVGVVYFLSPYKSDIILLYVMSTVIVTVLEWLTGFILEKIFHNKWWDYSQMPLNLNGYVCLLFSLIWGIACVIIVKWIHPVIFKGIRAVPEWLGYVFIFGLSVAVFADLYVTVTRILKLNKHLEKMEEIASELHKISDEIGENIYKDVIEAMEKREEVSEEIRERIQELRAKYHELATINIKLGKRLLKAFPKMQPKRYREAFQDLQKYLKRK